MVHITLSLPPSLSNSMPPLLTKATFTPAHDQVWKAMLAHRAPFLSTERSKAMVETYRPKVHGGLRSERGGSKGNLHYSKVRAVPLHIDNPLRKKIYKELGINFSHIRAKSMTVLNPLRRIDEHIMDDADLAGPILFLLGFGTFLLFVSSSHVLTRMDVLCRHGSFS
jgi:hypothetical protein